MDTFRVPCEQQSTFTVDFMLAIRVNLPRALSSISFDEDNYSPPPPSPIYSEQHFLSKLSLTNIEDF